MIPRPVRVKSVVFYRRIRNGKGGAIMMVEGPALGADDGQEHGEKKQDESRQPAFAWHSHLTAVLCGEMETKVRIVSCRVTSMSRMRDAGRVAKVTARDVA